MINRHGDNYHFKKLNESTYQFMHSNLKYCRFGGRDGQDKIDFKDLGYVDPSGGPFIPVGSLIDGRTVVRISVEGIFLDNPDRIIIEVK